MFSLRFLRAKPAVFERIRCVVAQDKFFFATFSSNDAPMSNLDIIKKLREMSGAPMMDVKKSLDKNDYDIELAFQHLRKQGLAAISKKAGRTAAEGLVGLGRSTGGVAVVEVNCETDFVARMDSFMDLTGRVAQAAADRGSLGGRSEGAGGGEEMSAEKLLEGSLPSGDRVSEAVDAVAVATREKVMLRRGFWLEGGGGSIGTYIHKSPALGVGSIAAAVVLQCPDQALDQMSAEAQAQINALAVDVAMHVVASKPAFLSRSSVTSRELDKELDVLRAQAEASKKPPEIVDKIIKGRLNKFYEEVCLVDQKFIKDESGKSVQKVITELGSQLKVSLELVDFIRVEVGEGIEKEVKDFAAEVRATAGN